MNQIFEQINFRLNNELCESVLMPQIGVQRTRKILHTYGFDMPALYDMDPEGDELAIRLEQTDEMVDNGEDTFLYLIYCLSENDVYDFHAEVITQQELNEIISEEDTEDE